MALPYLPKRGEILICDFDDVALGAEMVKRRPVVVVSRKDTHRSRLCTVVPLSTTAPDPVQAWHLPLPHISVTGWVAANTMWAKCDMLATVSHDRLNKAYRKTRHGRQFVEHLLADGDVQAILAGIRAYLAL